MTPILLTQQIFVQARIYEQHLRLTVPLLSLGYDTFRQCMMTPGYSMRFVEFRFDALTYPDGDAPYGAWRLGIAPSKVTVKGDT